MRASATGVIATGLLLVAVLGLPVVGAALAGHNLDRLRQFPPPLELPTGYPTFSWLAAGAILALLVTLIATWSAGAAPGHRTSPNPADATRATGRAPRHFPGWGWLALVWTLAWWVIAWTRLPLAAPLQRFTFFPLWLGFILVLAAYTEARTGTCRMRRRPRQWASLFIVSAGFWWLFEWLNRFVQNWHYLGVEGLEPWAYGLHATLSFSTVLPAVAGVAEALESHPGWVRRVQAGPAWRWVASRRTAGAAILIGLVALVGTGAYPRAFYPALWVAPLLLLLGTAVLAGGHRLPPELAAGNWRRALTWMLAALICGFMWELWNWGSFARWIYTVPGVERWHLFEMPLLGYTGYLPFGLECLLVVERLGVNRAGTRATSVA